MTNTPDMFLQAVDWTAIRAAVAKAAWPTAGLADEAMASIRAALEATSSLHPEGEGERLADCVRHFLRAHDASALHPDDPHLEGIELDAIGEMRGALAALTPSTVTEGTVPAGMKAWHGGDAAPADASDPVVILTRGGSFSCMAKDAVHWRYGTFIYEFGEPMPADCEVVAYTPKPAKGTVPDDGVGQDAALERVKSYIAELLLALQPFASAAERADAENAAREGPSRDAPRVYPWNYVNPTHFADAFSIYSDRLDPDDLQVLAASPKPTIVEASGMVAPDEDWLTDVLDDSLDMDWTGRVGARAIIAAWGKRHVG